MKFSIIIPVYNEEKTVAEIIRRVKKVNYPGQVEIIAVNDASSDKSAEIIKKISKVVLLENKTNRGKGYSLRRGFKKATGDIILVQDGDLEYDPQDHLTLIDQLINKNVYAVYGSRFIRGHSKPRYTTFYLGNIFLSFLTRIIYGKKITDMETCYKAFKRDVLNKIKLTENRFGFEPEITCKLLKNGLDILEVPIKYKSRSYKEGKKIGIKDGIRAIYLLLKYNFIN